MGPTSYSLLLNSHKFTISHKFIKKVKKRWTKIAQQIKRALSNPSCAKEKAKLTTQYSLFLYKVEIFMYSFLNPQFH